MAKMKSPETWNTLTGVMRVWSKTFKKHKYPSLSVTVSHKNDDDGYDNMYFKVRLASDAKELEMEEGENWLAVENAFLTCETYEDKKGVDHTIPVIVITSAEIVDAPESEPAPKKGTKKTGKKKSSSDDDEDD